jgi:hypothetical protein
MEICRHWLAPRSRLVLGLVGCSLHPAGPLKFGNPAPGRGGLSSAAGNAIPHEANQ